jgi:hypothetical protein
MKKKILTAILCVVTCSLQAQITTDEQPYGLLKKGQHISVQKEIKTVTEAHKARIVKEDKENDVKPGPVRFAFGMQVNYTLENSGTWQELEDGRKLWQLEVSMSGALSTNTYYDRFWLPEGAKFFVYSKETGQSIGAVTFQYLEGNRAKPASFATALIYGENVVYEYCQPATVKESAVISISRIDYGYRYVNNPYQVSLRSFGDAGSCQVNINCSEGNNWQIEKHAVAKVTIPMDSGTYACSCALVNNTNNNLTPYVLTADHCLVDNNNNRFYDAVSSVANPNASGMMFYWEYEHPGCANSSTPPQQRTTNGATVVANNSASDFALFRLTQDPRNATGVTP